MTRALTGIALAGALAASTSLPAWAGNLVEPEPLPEVIEPAPEPEQASTLPLLIIPLILVGLIAVAAGHDDDEETADSDVRLKTDILRVGTAENGLPLYEFRYVGKPGTYVGVMAQDVLAHTPEAVITRANGYYAVDYGMLGLEMTRIR